MPKKLYRILSALLGAVILVPVLGGLMLESTAVTVAAADDPIVLRICNSEEYIDEGGWDEDEAIDLESETIFGENSLIDDFEEWFAQTYGREVIVEYSCFGTNEELYSQLTLGDVYDIVCPSEYMFMKLLAEGKLQALSDDFFDEENENNYYIRNVSPYIRETFEQNEINGEQWSRYAAGYMWGTTGIVYNPDKVTYEDASTWKILENPTYYRQITIKDSVRDGLFPTQAIVNADLLISEEFINSEDYHERLAAIINDTSEEAIAAAEAELKKIRANVYSFETDSGKADMVSGKVVANLQWSGDAVYAMDQAEEDDLYLEWAVPKETANLWFDGWCMLKEGIEQDPDKQIAAEAFINFLSIPENVIRNMYYIGYTSCISGGDSPLIYEYLEWNYAAEDDEEDVVEYPLGYFFSGDNSDEDYILIAPAEQAHRQLSAQYPTEEEISRTALMEYFDTESNARVNQMWINIRCFNLDQIPARNYIIAGAVVVGIAAVIVLCNIIGRIRVNRRSARRRAGL